MISVIVVDSPYFATLDEKGSFSIAGVPDGKAHLKVWARGRWAHEQEIDTGSRKSADRSRCRRRQGQGNEAEKEAAE